MWPSIYYIGLLLKMATKKRLFHLGLDSRGYTLLTSQAPFKIGAVLIGPQIYRGECYTYFCGMNKAAAADS